jgi:hypothetical protein
VFLEWFRQEWAVNIPIPSQVLRAKTEELALKLNIEFTHSNEWDDQFRRLAGLNT